MDEFSKAAEAAFVLIGGLAIFGGIVLLVHAITDGLRREVRSVEELLLVKKCAWCQREFGEEARANETHGICERHIEQELAKLNNEE